MRLTIHVHGLQFVVSCGEGAQSVKWLGLVVAQRYALMAPHGRCRTREDAHHKPGFFLPASVFKTHTGQVLAPSKIIAECCKDNEGITVQLQQEVAVNEIGAPQFSVWSIAAFSSAQAKSLAMNGIDPFSTAASSKASEDDDSKAGDTNEAATSVDGAGRTPRAEAKTEEEEMKDYARAELLQQVNSGKFQSEMETEAAFLYDWSRLRIDELEKDTKEREGLQDMLLGFFDPINAAFMHYAVGSGEMAYGMNGHELAHFLHDCELYNVQRDMPAIDKLFTSCVKHDTFQSLYDRATLARVGFFHALLRAILSSPGNAPGRATKEIIEVTMKEKVLPTIARLTSGPFRDHTHHDKTVAVFQEAKAKLLKLYSKYAQESVELAPRHDSEGATSSWPLLLTSAGLKSMLYDCGVFCVGDPTEHNAIFEKAIDQCFTGMSEHAQPEEHGVLVFSEFIEVVARVGMNVLGDDGLPARDAIKLTLDALRSLPVKPSSATRK